MSAGSTRAARIRWASWGLGVLGAAGVSGVVGAAGRIGGADAPHLMSVDLRLGQLLLSGDLVHAARAWWALLAPQPPFGAVLGTLCAVVTSGRPVGLMLAMGLTLLLVFDALQRLSLRMTGGRLGGGVAWLAVLASPFTWSSVEQYSRDLSAGAAVLQALSWVCMPGALATRRSAVGFGAWMGIAFATKYTSPVFLVGPCLVVGLALVHARSRAAWAGLGVAGLTFAGVAGAWYAVHWANVWRYLFVSLDPVAMKGVAASLRDVNSLDAKVYYVATLWEAMSAPVVALLALGAAFGGARKDSRLGATLLVAATLVGTFALSRTAQQVDRYVYPGFLLACALLVPLGRTWIGAVVAIVALGPGLAASAARFAPGQPGKEATYTHGLAELSRSNWPITQRSFFPSDFRPEAWNLDGAVAAAGAVQGRDGTVGLLVGDGPGRPTFAHFAIRASALGYRWDWATVNVQGGGPMREPVFVGPLFDGAWPPTAFDTLIAVKTHPIDGRVSSWLAQHPGVERSRVRGEGNVEIVVYNPQSSR